MRWPGWLSLSSSECAPLQHRAAVCSWKEKISDLSKVSHLERPREGGVPPQVVSERQGGGCHCGLGDFWVQGSDRLCPQKVRSGGKGQIVDRRLRQVQHRDTNKQPPVCIPPAPSPGSSLRGTYTAETDSVCNRIQRIMKPLALPLAADISLRGTRCGGGASGEFETVCLGLDNVCGIRSISFTNSYLSIPLSFPIYRLRSCTSVPKILLTDRTLLSIPTVHSPWIPPK